MSVMKTIGGVLGMLGAEVGYMFRQVFRPRPSATGRAKSLNRPIVAVIAVVATVVSLAYLAYQMIPRQPKLDLNPYIGIGERMAGEITKLVGQKGHLVLVTMEVQDFRLIGQDAQIEAFERALKKLGGPSISATEHHLVGSRVAGPPSGGFPRDLYIRLLERYAYVDAFVSFVGPPELTDKDYDLLPQRLPKMLIFSQSGVGLKKLFKEGIIQVAILPNRHAGSAPVPDTMTPAEWFSRYYEVVTPAEADSLGG